MSTAEEAAQIAEEDDILQDFLYAGNYPYIGD
jgi:hypothetical protein